MVCQKLGNSSNLYNNHVIKKMSTIKIESSESIQDPRIQKTEIERSVSGKKRNGVTTYELFQSRTIFMTNGQEWKVWDLRKSTPTDPIPNLQDEDLFEEC